MKVRHLILITAWVFIITTWILWFTPYAEVAFATSLVAVAIAFSALFVNPEARL